VDKRSGAADKLDVIAFEVDLILNVIRPRDFNSAEHLDLAHTLLAKEVTEFEEFSLSANIGIDGKVSIHKTHGVSEALSGADDHVGHVTAHSAHGRKNLTRTGPNLNLQGLCALLIIEEEHIDGKMLEVLLQLSAGPLDDNGTSLDLHLASRRDGEDTRAEHGLGHFASPSRTKILRVRTRE